MIAAQVALEKLRQRDQLLKTENEMLKVEIPAFSFASHRFLSRKKLS